MPVIPGCPYFEIPYKLSLVLHYPAFVICFSWCVVYIVSLLLCQVHHLFCKLFRAESCSSHNVLSEAHTIFLDSKEWSSVILKDQYLFILLAMNTVWGFFLPSLSEESELPQKKAGFVLAQMGCIVTKGLRKKLHPNKQTNKTPSSHHCARELVVYMRRMVDICGGNPEMIVPFCSVNISM